jgi:uncharacterized protein (TIGR02594 family)
MNFPPAYPWLSTLGQLPRTIQQAMRLYGTQEIVGKGSNKTILQWRDELNLAGVKIAGYSDDDIPWCGLFAAIVCHRAGKPVVKDPLWALNWAKFGTKAPKASLGDVLAFKRPSGGHVGFYVAEDPVCYHVLGGNQSNKANITRIAKARLVAVRRPPYNNPPASVRPFLVKPSGIISTNEA